MNFKELPNNEVFVEGLAKNAKMLALFSGFKYLDNEFFKVYEEGIIPQRVYKEYLNKNGK